MNTVWTTGFNVRFICDELINTRRRMCYVQLRCFLALLSMQSKILVTIKPCHNFIDDFLEMRLLVNCRAKMKRTIRLIVFRVMQKHGVISLPESTYQKPLTAALILPKKCEGYVWSWTIFYLLGREEEGGIWFFFKLWLCELVILSQNYTNFPQNR